MPLKRTRNGTGKAKPSAAERREAIRGLVSMISSEDPFVSVNADPGGGGPRRGGRRGAGRAHPSSREAT